LYTPKPAHLVWYKGQRYVCAPDAKEDPPKIVPGEFMFFLFCVTRDLLCVCFPYVVEHVRTLET
jgi:hypothetical protein